MSGILADGTGVHRARSPHEQNGVWWCDKAASIVSEIILLEQYSQEKLAEH
jgi:ribosomal protein S19E (S16A)